MDVAKWLADLQVGEIHTIVHTFRPYLLLTDAGNDWPAWSGKQAKLSLFRSLFSAPHTPDSIPCVLCILLAVSASSRNTSLADLGLFH